jgi:uncharacterized cupin superfamily protein
MATIFRHEDVDFKENTDMIDHYRLFTSSPRFSSVVNSRNLNFDLRLLNPGQFSFPYHFHRHAEELIMIISGTMTMRSQKGFDIMSQGDIVFFEMGETGAHQFHNHSLGPCAYLDIRTLIGVDVCEYPDSGKVNIIPPYEIYEKDSTVDYFKGEDKPLEKWEALKREK